jgi:cytochrome c oxidase subunit 2
MRARAVVMTQEGFDRWIQEQKQAAAAAGSAQGKTLFTQQCGTCHTLADAGTTQEVGPDLDKVLAGKSADFIRESIVNPNAEIAPGYQPGVMPQDFEQKLTAQQLDSLVEYLVETAGKG